MTIISLGLLTIATLLLAGYLMSRMPGESFHGTPRPLDAAQEALRGRLQAHVEELATRIGERNLWRHAELQQAAAYIEGEFRAIGLQTRRNSYAVSGREVHNIEASHPGPAGSEAVVVIGAHYDTVIGTPGANDNGTGVAALLELARASTTARFRSRLKFVAFVNEEPPFFKSGQMGSMVYARQLQAEGAHLAGMISLETLGHYSDRPQSQRFPLPLLRFFYPSRGNFVAFVGNFGSARLLKRSLGAFRRHAEAPAEGIVAPGWLPGIDWSDHWSFWQIGIPAIMVTDTAVYRYPHYHAPSDVPGEVDFATLTRVVLGLQGVIDQLAGPPPAKAQKES